MTLRIALPTRSTGAAAPTASAAEAAEEVAEAVADTGAASRELWTPAALWRASWWVVRRPALLVPTGLALLLVVATTSVLDEGYGLRVLRGVGVLLACALVTAADDPGGELAAASPFPRAVRTAVRVLSGAAVVATAWVLAAALVQWRAPDVPVLGVGLEALALAALGLAVATVLRAWRDQHAPSHAAVVAVAVLVFTGSALPRWYALQQGQTWGPPWQAAQIRWLALLLVGAGVVALALRDPLARRGTRART